MYSIEVLSRFPLHRCLLFSKKFSQILPQMQEWQGEDMNPEEFGWRLSNGKYHPVQGHSEPCLKEIAAQLCCSCKKDCSSQQCSCKKHGLNCSTACYFCQGQSCTNVGYLHVHSDIGLVKGTTTRLILCVYFDDLTVFHITIS